MLTLVNIKDRSAISAAASQQEDMWVRFLESPGAVLYGVVCSPCIFRFLLVSLHVSARPSPCSPWICWVLFMDSMKLLGSVYVLHGSAEFSPYFLCVFYVLSMFSMSPLCSVCSFCVCRVLPMFSMCPLVSLHVLHVLNVSACFPLFFINFLSMFLMCSLGFLCVLVGFSLCFLWVCRVLSMF